MGRIISQLVDKKTNEGMAEKLMAELFRSTTDRARIETRFMQIESYEGFARVAVRFLCHETTDQRLVILDGCIKKGDIPKSVENRAVSRRKELLESKWHVRDYPLATR
jgi:hypothetical protein